MRLAGKNGTEISLFQKDSGAFGKSVHLSAICSVRQKLGRNKLVNRAQMNYFCAFTGDHEINCAKMDFKAALFIFFERIALFSDFAGRSLGRI